jgi:hypothetical protein
MFHMCEGQVSQRTVLLLTASQKQFTQSLAYGYCNVFLDVTQKFGVRIVIDFLDTGYFKITKMTVTLLHPKFR